MFEPTNTSIVVLVMSSSIFILLLLISSRSKTLAEYDERQEVIRGRAYKYAFMSVLICSMIFGFILEFTKTSYVSPGSALLITAFLGATIFVDACIINDAFYSLNQNHKWYAIICIIIVVSTGMSVIDAIQSGEFSHKLTYYNAASLLCLILFINILSVMTIKTVITRKEDSHEES